MNAAGSAPAAQGITVPAPAKVNLWLHILGRRDDGYHLIDSLVAFVELGDTLTAAPAERLSLAVDGRFAATLPEPADNLVLRAAQLLAGAGGATTGGARIGLTKRLPVASGIGGGSADAAAALRALTQLWRLEIGEPALMALALRLGADLPVCLSGVPCHVGGIGETVAPAPPLPAADLLLVNPGVPLATAAVFAAHAARATPPLAPPARWPEPPADAAALAARLSATRNDLTESATMLVPAVGQALAALAAQPGCLLARMSGSGATCFGLFADRTGAEAAAARIQAAQPGWWVAPTRLRRPPGAERR